MSKSRAVSCDPGTMFFQVAEKQPDNSIKTQIIRNAFVEFAATEDTEETLKRNGWNFIKDTGTFYVVGEDALKVAKMFPGKVKMRRPMADGVLNKGEDKKMLIMDQLVEKTIGKAPDDKSVITTCVSSPAVDDAQDSEFHKKRLESLFKSRGWNVKVIEEALAVVLSERPFITEPDGTESAYSGIGISFGAGKVNCVLAYKGVQVIGMSVKRSGDWIDNQVANDTGVDISQVTAYKETKLDFDNIDLDSDVGFALDAYYGSMIKYVFDLFAKKFQEVKSQFDAPLDIVVAGGTSMPKGFVSKLKSTISSMPLPFAIKDVRHARDPRNAVVEGCLAHAIASQKKLEKEKIEQMLDK